MDRKKSFYIEVFFLTIFSKNINVYNVKLYRTQLQQTKRMFADRQQGRSHLPTGMAKKNSEYMGVRFSSSNISAISVGAIVEYDASPMPTSARKIMNTQ